MWKWPPPYSPSAWFGGAQAATDEFAVPEPPIQCVHAVDEEPRVRATEELAATDHAFGIHEMRQAGSQADRHVLVYFVGVLQAGGRVGRVPIPAVKNRRHRLAAAIPGNAADFRVTDAIAEQHHAFVAAIPLDDRLRGIFAGDRDVHVRRHLQALGDAIGARRKVEHGRLRRKRIEGLLQRGGVVGCRARHWAARLFISTRRWGFIEQQRASARVSGFAPRTASQLSPVKFMPMNATFPRKPSTRSVGNCFGFARRKTLYHRQG